jgi:hypothetical protein
MSRNGLLGSLGTVGLPLLAAALIGAPDAFADGGIGLPALPAPASVAVSVPTEVPAVPVVDTTVADVAATVIPAATAASQPPAVSATPPVSVVIHVVAFQPPSGGTDAGATPGAVAAAPAAPLPATPVRAHVAARSLHLSPAPRPAASPPDAAPASQLVRPPAMRDRRLPAPPAPDRPATGLIGGSAGGGGTGFVVLLLAVAATVLAVVRPRLGARMTSLLRVPHPAVLALELERPD